MQADQQMEMARIQAQQKSDLAKIQAQAATDNQQAQAEGQRDMLKLQNEFKARIAIAHIDAAAKIEVARITAGADTGDQAEAREASGEGMGEQAALPAPQRQPVPGGRPGDPMPDWIHAGMGGQLPQTQAPSRAPEVQITHQMLQKHAKQANTALKANGDGLTALAAALQQLAGKHEQLASHVADLTDSHHRSQAELLHALTSEKEVVRDRDGRASGVRIKRKEVMQ
jgi:hypothetical protein